MPADLIVPFRYIVTSGGIRKNADKKVCKLLIY